MSIGRWLFAGLRDPIRGWDYVDPPLTNRNWITVGGDRHKSVHAEVCRFGSWEPTTGIQMKQITLDDWPIMWLPSHRADLIEGSSWLFPLATALTLSIGSGIVSTIRSFNSSAE